MTQETSSRTRQDGASLNDSLGLSGDVDVVGSSGKWELLDEGVTVR